MSDTGDTTTPGVPMMDDATQAKLLAQLEAANSRMLEDHKREIEAKYEQRMQSFLEQFATAPPRPNSSGNNSSLLNQLHHNRPVLNAKDADIRTSQFYENARNKETAPQYDIIESGTRTATIRATMESTNKPPKQVVKSSGAPLDEVAKPKKKKVVSKTPTMLLDNPLGHTVAPAVWQKAIEKDKAKKAQKAERLREVLKEGNGDNASLQSSQSSPSVKVTTAAGMIMSHEASIEDNKDNNTYATDSFDGDSLSETNPIDPLLHKFDETTQYMLKKTSFILDQDQEFRSQMKKKDKKKKKKKAMSKKSSNEEEEREDSYKNYPVERHPWTASEALAINDDEDMIHNSDRLENDAIKLPQLGTTGSEPAVNVQHKLIKSVEFGDLPAVDTTTSDIKELYHADYQVKDTRVNNYEYKIDPHLALHKSDWENEIARHILSVYATSKSKTDIKKSKSIMKFVDIDKEDNIDTIKQYVESEDGRPMTGMSIKEDIEGEGVEEVDDEYEEGPVSVKSSQLSHNTSITDGRGGEEESVGSQFEGTVTAKEAGLSFREMPSFRNHSKYRSCITVRVGRTKHEPGELISIRGSPRVFPIWFVSSGEIYSNWTRLPGGEELQAQLSNLYEKRRFKEYLGIIEKIIDDMWRDRSLGKNNEIEDFLKRRKSTKKRVVMNEGVVLVGPDGRPLPGYEKQKKGKRGYTSPSHHNVSNNQSSQAESLEKMKWNSEGGVWGDENRRGNIWEQFREQEIAEEKARAELSNEELISLWGQLILTANAFGILLIEKKNFDMSLDILNKAEMWSKRKDILPEHVQKEVRPHICDAMAFYFYSRKKYMSSSSYTKMALEDHEDLDNVDHIAIGLLHTACILTVDGDFKEAHQVIYQVLAMVEEGRLSLESASPRQLCLVAIAYHNLAVVQLKMLVPDLACKSSQNARKIARLCLSYSNRWMHVFQWTHEVAMEDIKFQLTLKPKIPLNNKQLYVIKQLTEDMYDPDNN